MDALASGGESEGPALFHGLDLGLELEGFSVHFFSTLLLTSECYMYTTYITAERLVFKQFLSS